MAGRDTSGDRGPGARDPARRVPPQGHEIRLGEFHLKGIDLRLETGRYGVILGPTGAGKTVLLECIIGLHTPSAGRVLLDDLDMSLLPPEKRGVAYVPQDYCLFPHLTIAANIAFGLRLRRWPAEETERRVRELAELLHIEGLLKRRPLTLSGGEKQRVALARALAIDPKLLLLDEPLAAVDERTRERLGQELKAVQRRLGTTVLHVCHNFEEALALADDIAVFCDGEIRQVGPPDEVFHRPGSHFVARFMGCSNLIRGEVTGGQFTAGELRLPVVSELSGAATLVVRPEELRVGPPGGEGWAAEVTGVVRAQRFVALKLAAAGWAWEAIATPEAARELALGEGAPVTLWVPPERCHLLAGTEDAPGPSASEAPAPSPAGRGLG
ncbi:MAG: ATP-binding cassette domain-containing protein [Armatimonadetes bacterium]|nr:ATP-binding cassette domain-containing protein [Armatimonadota bacterium]